MLLMAKDDSMEYLESKKYLDNKNILDIVNKISNLD